MVNKMKFEEYTIDQQKAIISKGTNIIVSAGAGSGKTQVLTQRVIHFIKNENYKIDEFLILTFTNLAALEMKNRIRKALTEEGLEDAKYVDSADICTFDSYALGLVKKYHFMLNVSKDIKIIDSNIIEVRKRTILDTIFEKLYKEEDQVFLQMIAEFCFKDDIEIRNLILEIYNKALLELDTDAYLKNFIKTYFNDNLITHMIKEIFNKLCNERNELIKLIASLPSIQLSKKDPRPYSVAVKEVLHPYLNACTYNEIIAIPKSLGFNKPRNLTEQDNFLIKQFKDKYEKIYKLASKLPDDEIAFKESIYCNLEYTKKIIEIIYALDKKVFDYKNKYQVFEFNDIAKMSLSLVTNNEAIKKEIKNKLKMIMVDEYQDTSSIQEAFINQIASDNVYMVGDVKQSIYRFRNARCDIFIDKYNKYKNFDGGMAIDLKKNFRSRKEVLSDINYIFKTIMTEECGGASYKKDHLIEYGNTKFDEKDNYLLQNHSDIILYEKNNQDQAFLEAHLIARDIINKINNNYQVYDSSSPNRIRPCNFSDFCILMDRGSAFETYAKIFSEYKLPLFIENDENIKESDIVLILSNILKLMKYIKNHDYVSQEFIKSFISISRSFIYNYSDEQIYQICNNKSFKEDLIIKQIQEELYKTSMYPIYTQFENLLFSLDIYNKCILYGEVTKNEKYLDTFLDMFKTMSSLDYTLDDFISYLEYIDTYDLKINLSSSGSSIDSIKLMNIHKSKGLEFNIVYFSGLYRNFNQSEYKKSFGMSNKFGIIFPQKDPNKESVIKALNKDRETKEDLSERIRLFYVALTRTKEKMIFLCDSTLYKYYQEKFNINLLNTFVQNNNLNSIANDQLINQILDGYNNKLITKEVFDMLCLNYEIEYIEDLNLEKNEKQLRCLNDDYQVHYFYNDQELLRGVYAFLNNKITKEQLKRYISFFNLELDCIYIDQLKNTQYAQLNLNKLILGHQENYISNEKFINTLKANNLCISDYLLYFKLFFDYYPNQLELNTSINYLGNGNNDFSAFEKVIKYLGYDITKKGLNNLKQLISCSDEEIIDVLNTNYDDYFIPNNYLINHQTNNFSLIGKDICSRFFKMYQENQIDLEEFKSLINVFNYELDVDFLNLNESFKKQTLLGIDRIITQKEVSFESGNIKNFKDLFASFIDYPLFNKYIISLELEEKLTKLISQNIEFEQLVVKPFEINKNIVNTFTASKKINLDANKKNLEFGTMIHSLLEIVDFENPNYDLISDQFYRNIIKNFLSSDLLKDIKKGKVFKEYEFYDEKNLTRGIIDLLVVYDNHVDIIDYKTKNIDDESYVKQLQIYETYINQLLGVKVNTYLYSLLSNNVKKCN